MTMETGNTDFQDVDEKGEEDDYESDLLSISSYPAKRWPWNALRTIDASQNEAA